jgi:prepilin-type N-terminal cleavage/methylation domain-containing protein
MRLQRTFPCIKARPGGFTLVEVLVSMTVLTVMVGMFGTMMLSMGQYWQDAEKRVNNFTKARAMLDLMASDIQSGVFRSELSDFPTTSLLAFYTERPGVGTDPRDLSIVGYSLNGSTLQRSCQAVAWTDVAQPLSSSTTLSPQDAAAGVLDFKMLFLQSNGTLSSTYGTNTRAIGITLAVVDDDTLIRLTQANKVTALNTALEANASMTRSVKADWETYLNNGGMNWGIYPKGLGVGLKVFERYVYLPSSP